MNKEAARIFARTNVKSLPKQARQAFDEQIYQRVISSTLYKNSSSLFVYVSLKSEVSTQKLIKKAIEDGKRVFAPITQGEKMFAVELTSDTKFVRGALKINEPVGVPYVGKIDLAVVPMSAYDTELNRVGKGGGFYDRFLKERRIVKLGIAYSCQQVPNVSAEEFDVPMDVIINEKEIICG